MTQKRSQRKDPNMQTAYLWAIEPFLSTALPHPLQDVTLRAEFVNDMDAPTLANCLELDFYEKLSKISKTMLKKSIADWSKQFMPATNGRDRVSISLRLWSGCISAAKVIAKETMSGPVTPELRRQLVRYVIGPYCRIDPIYRAGVEAAPAFRKLRGAECFFEGVPKKFMKKMEWL